MVLVVENSIARLAPTEILIGIAAEVGLQQQNPKMKELQVDREKRRPVPEIACLPLALMGAEAWQFVLGELLPADTLRHQCFLPLELQSEEFVDPETVVGLEGELSFGQVLLGGPVAVKCYSRKMPELFADLRQTGLFVADLFEEVTAFSLTPVTPLQFSSSNIALLLRIYQGFCFCLVGFLWLILTCFCAVCIHPLQSLNPPKAEASSQTLPSSVSLCSPLYLPLPLTFVESFVQTLFFPFQNSSPGWSPF